MALSSTIGADADDATDADAIDVTGRHFRFQMATTKTTTFRLKAKDETAITNKIFIMSTSSFRRHPGWNFDVVVVVVVELTKVSEVNVVDNGSLVVSVIVPNAMLMNVDVSV